MRHLLHLSILLGSILTAKSAVINSKNESNIVNQTKLPETESISNVTATIEALRKEKEDLYNKIHKAIDEAIPELEKTNDSDAKAGLEHLKTLKEQITQIHEADSDEVELPIGTGDDNSTTTVVLRDYRRQLADNNAEPDNVGPDNVAPDNVGPVNVGPDNVGPDNVGPENVGRQGRDWFAHHKKQKDEFYQKLMKNRNKMYTSAPKILNRQKIANQIEQWLIKKAEEKRKKKELMLDSKIRNERCPYFGRGRKRKNNFIKGKKKSLSPKTYPCCRKCCKSSYLGCL